MKLTIRIRTGGMAMTYEELVQKVREAYSGVDVSNINEHVAIEVNIRGEAEGAFYIEIRRGRVLVEPYEYYDRDAIITTSAETILAIARGELDVEEADNSGKVRIRGNLDKTYLLNEIIYT